MFELLSCVLMISAGVLIFLELRQTARLITANGRRAMLQLHSDRIDRTASRTEKVKAGPGFLNIAAENSELVFFALCAATVIQNTNIMGGVCFLCALFVPMAALWYLDLTVSREDKQTRTIKMEAMAPFYVLSDLALRVTVIVTCVSIIIWSLEKLN